MLSAEKKKILTTPRLILLCGCVAFGLFLLVLSGNMSDKESNEGERSEAIVRYDEKEYEKETVEKIEELCASVNGVGSARVAVTLDGTYKAVYAVDMQTGSSVKNEHVLIGSGSSEEALLLGYTPPDILGVGIVCDGGDDPRIRAELISLVAAVFDLPTNKIYVTSS